MKYELPHFDELTTRPLLPKSALVHGAYYKGRCRNASVARWNADEQCFYHWRQKFNSIFIETIKHPEDDEVFDVFRVLEEIPSSKLEIPFKSQVFVSDVELLIEFNNEVWSRPVIAETQAPGESEKG